MQGTCTGCRAEASCWNEGKSCTWSHPDVACRHTVEAAVAAVHVPDSVIDVLTSLRDYLQDKCEPPIYVSDRRFMKAINLLQVAAHADNREEVGPRFTSYRLLSAAVCSDRLHPAACRASPVCWGGSCALPWHAFKLTWAVAPCHWLPPWCAGA